jgi:uncharacterized protein YbjT (DUF2867 family)
MILVSGASGTVGSEVVKALRARGARLRLGFHSAQKAAAARAAGHDAVAMDYERPESLGPALAGIESVYLVSVLATPELNVVRAAKAAGVRRIIKQSVWGAAGESFSFARWHRPVERAIEESGLEWTFLRPNGFMQNFVNFMAATIREQGAFYLPTGDSRVSHVDVRDIARVAAHVLTEPGHAGKAYELSGPAGLSYAEIARELSGVLGREIRYVELSFEDYKKAAVAAGVPEAYADALVDLYRFYIQGGAGQVTAAVQEITAQAPIPFAQFARDHAAAWR